MVGAGGGGVRIDLRIQAWGRGTPDCCAGAAPLCGCTRRTNSTLLISVGPSVCTSVRRPGGRGGRRPGCHPNSTSPLCASGAALRTDLKQNLRRQVQHPVLGVELAQGVALVVDVGLQMRAIDAGQMLLHAEGRHAGVQGQDHPIVQLRERTPGGQDG